MDFNASQPSTDTLATLRSAMLVHTASTAMNNTMLDAMETMEQADDALWRERVARYEASKKENNPAPKST